MCMADISNDLFAELADDATLASQLLLRIDIPGSSHRSASFVVSCWLYLLARPTEAQRARGACQHLFQQGVFAEGYRIIRSLQTFFSAHLCWLSTCPGAAAAPDSPQ